MEENKEQTELREQRKTLRHKRFAGFLIAVNILLFLVVILEIVLIILSLFK